MTKVKVVTVYVPLHVKHMTPLLYHELGTKMIQATCGRGKYYAKWLEDCWLHAEKPPMVPATETPSDRYDTPEHHAESHIVQHSRTQWAMQLWEEEPDLDVIVWLDYGILKQGDFTNKKITPAHITEFLDKLEEWDPKDIPFPGIEEKKPVLPHGNNWRFCGSTHIWPTKFLKQIDHAYRFELRDFIYKHGKIPLDLAIWPAVEQRSGLPFRWYKAEYDYTQLTNFPF